MISDIIIEFVISKMKILLIVFLWYWLLSLAQGVFQLKMARIIPSEVFHKK